MTVIKESVALNAVMQGKRAVCNFGAGPSVLPPEVIEEAGIALSDYDGSGLSILEIGHRSKLFQKVIDEATQLLKELMGLDKEHDVLFLPGGASTQFFQVPMNLLDDNSSASYTDTGIWATKAIKEAKLFGNVEVVCSSRDEKYRHLPKNFHVHPSTAYLHITTNNTVYGTQWQDLSLFYEKNVPLVADMSSDILSRKINFNAFDLIYAGAQKNIGAAGVNVVVINKRCLGKVQRKLPTMIDYRNHLDAGSLLNTPPVFAIYICMLTLRWLKNSGGVEAAQKRNQEKSDLFYSTLDSLPLFEGTVNKEDRSKMNACFIASDHDLEKEFLDLCEKEKMTGLKGHRTVGGFRVSMYNALPSDCVQNITDLMKHFAERKG